MYFIFIQFYPFNMKIKKRVLLFFYFLMSIQLTISTGNSHLQNMYVLKVDHLPSIFLIISGTFKNECTSVLHILRK